MAVAEEEWGIAAATSVGEPDAIDLIRDQWIRHGWIAAADGMTTVVELVRVCSLLTNRIDAALRPFDLTMSRYEVLMYLSTHRSERLTVTTMGRALQVHATSVTSSVQRLEAQGLVSRTPDPGDSRRVVVRLTQRGAELVEITADRLGDLVFRRLGLTDAEHRTLWRILRSLRRASGDF